VVLGGSRYKFNEVFANHSLLWSGLIESVNFEVSIAVNVCAQAELPGVDCPRGAGVCAFVPDAGETDNAGSYVNATFSALTSSKGAMVLMNGSSFPAFASIVYLVCNPQVLQATIVRVDVMPFQDHAIFSISVEAAAACPVD
jgi:hypothetical protein